MDNKPNFSYDDSVLFSQTADTVEALASFLLKFADDLRSDNLTPDELEKLLIILRKQYDQITTIELVFQKMVDLSSLDSQNALVIQNKNNILMFPSPFNDSPA
jgi:hypothetical protein